MELLVVIAVIGIIAAIAIPAMSGIFGKSETTKTKRNAQNIAGIFGAAQAAGNTATYPDKAAAVAAVTQGGIFGAGAFSGSQFLAAMSADEAAAAGEYLGFDASTSMITYVPGGGQTVSGGSGGGGASPPTDPNPNPWTQATSPLSDQNIANILRDIFAQASPSNEYQVIAQGSQWTVQSRPRNPSVI